jgi:hypothetical protein
MTETPFIPPLCETNAFFPSGVTATLLGLALPRLTFLTTDREDVSRTVT